MSKRGHQHTPVPADTNAGVESGQTRVQQNGVSAPKLPHERDQSTGPSAGQPDPDGPASHVGQQAFDDVERGLVDTDKGPVLERLYKKVKRNAP